jgi:pimeloyl-ACP methyl ester carboxylesterase
VTLLAWQRGGTLGGPAVVLLHAWSADGPGQWGPSGLVGALERAGAGVYVPDLPGHGESADVPIREGANPGSWTAEVVLADLAKLGVDRCSVVGYAEGALVAGHVAVRAEPTVSHVALLGCDDRVAIPHGAEVANALRDRAARLWSSEASAAVARARRDRRHNLATLADWAEGIAWPAAARLGALRMPVLLAVGADDGERRERLPRLARLFHDARLLTVPGDESTMLASADLHRAIVDFIRS